MLIPNDLQQSIEKLFENISTESLKRASSLLSHCYLEGKSLHGKEELLAYLIVRLPATYAALTYVFTQISPPTSLLDLGAGPATAYWAAKEVWDPPPSITALEKEPYFIELGKTLGAHVSWSAQDLLTFPSFEKHDWALLSYSLGEIPDQKIPEILRNAWNSVTHGVIIVEPGTPRGYQKMLLGRQTLIDLGGHMVAPCPHSQRCPMPSPDWCHFSVRLQRSYLHRLAKYAQLPFEDEKFSYAILSKTEFSLCSRIIRSPLHRSGHTLLPLCTPEGLINLTISRKHKELYKKARKSQWGDRWTS